MRTALLLATSLLLLAAPSVAADAAAIDAAPAADERGTIPCTDDFVGKLLCLVTNAINEHCERELGEPCIL